MKKKEKTVNHCKQCYYVACCIDKSRGVACTGYKRKVE